MSNKIFNTRVKNKRDTEANWKSKNPVLLDGEIIIVTTTSGDTRFKVGDGKKTYNQLPFQDQKTRDLIPSVDSSLSSTSTNPVQNKIIKSELDKKAERDVVNTTTNGLMSVADKKKLDGIDTGANKITVDTSLSSTSTNPVQNKVVNSAINNLNTLVGDTAVSTQITNAVANKVDKVSGKGLSANDYTTTEKNKLAGISENAEVNQNAFSNVVVGSTTISADSKTDTLTLVAGSNVTLTPDSTNDKITITAKDTTYSASTSTPLMDGTASVGTSSAYSRGDHVHPSDTSKLSTSGGVLTGTVYLDSGANLEFGQGSEISQNYIGIEQGVVELGRGDIKFDTTVGPMAADFSNNVSVTMSMLSLNGVSVEGYGSDTYGESKFNFLGQNSDEAVIIGGVGTPTVDTHAANKAYVDSKLSGKLDKSGGTLTGNLTGKYITGTWLQATAATDLGRAPRKVAVLDDSGWVYYRTPSELLSDIGGVAINNFIDTIYPLGSIYITTSSTHPNVLFPNTFWLPIYDRFLLGGGNNYGVGSTGGEATHVLTTSEMPEHNHSIFYPNSGAPSGEANICYPADSGIKKTWYAEMCKTSSAGAGVAHNNMPPYLAVYVWKRVTFDEYEAGI